MKDRGKDNGHGKNSHKDVMGKSYMAKKKEKKKKMTIRKNNKMVDSLITQIKI